MEALFAEYYAVDISRKQKDSANYRRHLGITLGQPPFGTVGINMAIWCPPSAAFG